MPYFRSMSLDPHLTNFDILTHGFVCATFVLVCAEIFVVCAGHHKKLLRKQIFRVSGDLATCFAPPESYRNFEYAICLCYVCAGLCCHFFRLCCIPSPPPNKTTHHAFMSLDPHLKYFGNLIMQFVCASFMLVCCFFHLCWPLTSWKTEIMYQGRPN